MDHYSLQTIKPSTRLPFVNNPILHLPERNLVAAANFSGTGRDCNLFLIDIDSLSIRRKRLPVGEKGVYGFVKASDGCLYLGTFAGIIYRYDPQDDSLSVVARPFQNPDGESTGLIWGGLATSNGKVYMGVYSSGDYCQYDIASGKTTIFQTIQERDGLGYYASVFLELPDGNILVFVGGARPTLFLHKPGCRKAEKIPIDRPLPTFMRFEGFRDDNFAFVNLDGRLELFDWRKLSFAGPALQNQTEPIVGLTFQNGRLYGLSPESGAVYELCGNEAVPVRHELKLKGGRLIRWLPGKNGELLSLTDNGLFVRFDPATGRVVRKRQLPNRSKTGMEMSMVVPQPEGELVVGAHFINMQIYLANLKTGSYTAPGNKVSGYVGQITCGTWVGRKFYFASYGNAVLYRYDPEQPFLYSVNPAIIGRIEHNQNRPVAMHEHKGWLYIATKSDYGVLGGAISAYHLETGVLDVYRDYVPDQSPQAAIFFDPESGRLAGGTGIPGDQGSAIPTAKAATLFVWDTEARQTVACIEPWQTATLLAAGLSTDGIMVGFGENQMYCLNVRSLKCETRDWKHGAVKSGIFVDQNLFLGAGRTNLFCYDITDGKYKELPYSSEKFERMTLIGKDRIVLAYNRVELREISLAKLLKGTLQL